MSRWALTLFGLRPSGLEKRRLSFSHTNNDVNLTFSRGSTLKKGIVVVAVVFRRSIGMVACDASTSGSPPEAEDSPAPCL